MLRYPSVERIERTVKRRTLNWIRRLACAGTLLSGLKLQVQLAVGEIADFCHSKKKLPFSEVSETFRYRLLCDLTPLCATFPLPDWSTSSVFSCLIDSFLCTIGNWATLYFV